MSVLETQQNPFFLKVKQSHAVFHSSAVSFFPLQVRIDGEDLKNLHLGTLRENIGVVSQEPILFGFTIRENIILGKPNARNEEIVQAAKEANCHDFIENLPQVCIGQYH